MKENFPRENAPQSPAARGETKFPGIVEDAATLGVSRVHLWLVLSGQRPSQSLLIRYRALKRGQRRAGKKRT